MEMVRKIKKWLARCVEGNYFTALIVVGAVLGTAFLMLMPTPINRFLVEDAGPTIVEYIGKAFTCVIGFMGKTLMYMIKDVREIGRALLGWYDPAIEQIVYGGFRLQWLPYVAVVGLLLAGVVMIFVLNRISRAARWLYAHRPVIMWRSAYQRLLDICDSQYKSWKTTFDHSHDQNVKHRIEVERLQRKLVELEQRLYETRTGGRRAVQNVREDLTDWLLGEWWVGEYAKVHLKARRRKPVGPTVSVGVV